MKRGGGGVQGVLRMTVGGTEKHELLVHDSFPGRGLLAVDGIRTVLTVGNDCRHSRVFM